MATAADALTVAVRHHQAGELPQAEQLYLQILQTDPRHADAHHLLGVLALQRGHYQQAISSIGRALEINPRAAAFHSNLGLAYQALGQNDQALACFQTALRLDPHLPDAHNGLGFLLQNQGQIDAASKHFQAALKVRPDFADALINLGTVLFGQGKVDEAAAQFHQALRLKPDSVQGHNNLGLVFAAKGKLEEAITFYRQALKLDPTYFQAHNNLGNTLCDLGQLDTAASCYEQALRLNPHYAKACNNLGNVRKMQGRYTDALACYVDAMRLDPDNLDTHRNRACLWLALGDWENGWGEMEVSRVRMEIDEQIAARPRWDGSDLQGRVILLHSEQGFGDTIQFIRYAALVKQLGARVVVQCQAPLTRLLSTVAGIDELVAEGSPLPAFDCQAQLLSVPNYLKTRLDTVPAQIPYLHADETLVERWRQELKALGGLKIGIAWQGNLNYRADRQRSIPLAKFASLATREDVQLISLQKGTGTDQLQSCPFPVHDLGNRLDESAGAFMDTAAVMKNLDLVVTSDTAIAHLAGALGVPTWVALTLFPDWRWLLDREDCPWYPTMRLFRQRRFGDWDDVFDRIGNALHELKGAEKHLVVAATKKKSSAPPQPANVPDVKDLLTRAWKHYETGELDLAANNVRQLLHWDAAHGEAWCLLGTICQGQGNLAESETCHRRSLQVTPGNATALAHLGVLLAHQGKLDEAAQRLEDALRCQPADAEVLNNLGVVRAQQGQRQAAVHHFQQALRIRPDYAEAHTNLGLAWANEGNFDNAVHHYQEAMRLNPANGKAHTELGNALKSQGKLDEAIIHFREAARLQPQSADAQRDLASALRQHDKWDQAAFHYEEALRLEPSAHSHNDLGNIRRSQQRPTDAQDHFREALRLNPQYAEAHSNWGAMLREQGQLDDAEAHFQEALRLKPDLAEAYNNLANTQRDKGNFGGALAAYEKALRVKADFPEARWNRSLVRLLLGDFERGWPEYEFRWRSGHAWRKLPQPLWDGSPLAGRTILLWSEQGLGDTLHFIRYAALVQQRGGRVIVECQPALMNILAGVKGIDYLVARGSQLPAFEVHAPLLSLPRIFGASIGHMPATVPYLEADTGLVEKWRVASDEWRVKNRTRLLIGIAWQGNPTFDGDRQRSIPLAQFVPLAKVPGVRFISLQKGPGVEQLPGVADHLPIHDLANKLDNDHGAFMDTAAVMKNLDLVISSDTAIPHLAGALAVPVWIALSYVPDWRWMLRRDDSPWYPTMRLFRQPRLGDWGSVFGRIAEALGGMVAERGN